MRVALVLFTIAFLLFGVVGIPILWYKFGWSLAWKLIAGWVVVWLAGGAAGAVITRR